MNTLPGIVSIRFTACDNLQPHLMHQSIAGAIVALAAPFQDINFYGIPKCQWEGALSSGCRQEKTTLEFATADHLPEGRRLAFVVTVASGKQYLIGTRESKYPQVTYGDTTGSPSGDAALRTYKITHIALKSMLPCIL